MDPNIGLKIKNRRRQMKMTLKELAGDVVTAAQISAVENGKCKPSKSLLQYIAEKLNCDVDYFVLTDEEVHRKSFSVIQKKCEPMMENQRYEDVIEIISEYKNNLQFLNNEQKGFFYYVYGCDSLKKNKFEESFNYFIKSETSYLQTTNLCIISTIYINIGNCLCKNGKYEAALGYYFNSLKYSKPCGNVYNDTRAKYNICICGLTLERYNKVQQYIDDCKKNIETYDFKDKEKFMPGLKLIQGDVNLYLKENDKSLKEFEEAFQKYKKENNFLGMGKAKNNSALCLWNKGEFEKAEIYFREAINYKKSSSNKDITDSYLNLAEMNKENGKIKECLELLEDAEENISKYNDIDGLIKILKMKFECYYEMKDYEKAEITAFLAIDCMQKNDDRDEAAKLYIRMAEMYKNNDDDKSCIEYALKAKSLIS